MAAIGARTLALIFGAGYSGSYIYNNQEKARVIADAIVGAANSQKRQTDPVSVQTAPNHEFTHLSHQVDRLAREVARNRTDPVIIMGGNGAGYRDSIAAVSNIFNLLGWAVVAVSVGGVVYYVAFRKRLRISDLAWVSQTTFNGTIETMQKGLARVRDTVGAVRHDLSNRLGLLKNQVDSVQTSLSHQIEEEVGEVQKGVNDVGAEVAGVKDMLDTVKSRIDDLDSKMDFATTGIMALIKAISSVAPHQVQTTAFDDLRQISKMSDSYAEISGGMMQKRLSSTGLAGLLGGATLDSSNSRTSLDMGSPSQVTGKPRP